MSKNEKKPLVNILSFSYNHAKYLKQTIESFVMQKTNFPFEVIISDDASTDNSQEIIKECAQKYPDIIKPFLGEKNIGITEITYKIYNKINAKYVALCDGDDYFSDPYKLQKQVDFLETHPECSLCFHPVKVVFEQSDKPDETFPMPDYRFNKDILTLEDIMAHNFIQTNSVMYRWRFSDQKFEDVFPRDIIPGDWFLHLMHADVGNIGFLDEEMAVYRRHNRGIFYEASNPETKENFYNKYARSCMLFYKAVNEYFKDRVTPQFRTKSARFIKEAIRSFLQTKEFDKLRELCETYPEYYDMSVKDMIEQLHNLVRENKELKERLK